MVCVNMEEKLGKHTEQKGKFFKKTPKLKKTLLFQPCDFQVHQSRLFKGSFPHFKVYNDQALVNMEE